jgi:hypothetical protein
MVRRPRAARLGHRPARAARSPSRASGARGGSVRLGHRPARAARSPSRACGARGGSVRLRHRPARAARLPQEQVAPVAAVCGFGIGRPGLLALPQEYAAPVAAVCGFGIGRPGLLALPQEHAAPVAAVCGFARRYVAQLLPVVLVSAGSPPTWESQQASARARVCTRRPEAAAWWLRHRPAAARSLRASGARGGRMRRRHLGQYVVQCR